MEARLRVSLRDSGPGVFGAGVFEGAGPGVVDFNGGVEFALLGEFVDEYPESETASYGVSFERPDLLTVCRRVKGTTSEITES